VRNAASQVVSMAVVVASGIRADGDREILGLDVGDSEDEVFWRGFLTSLKKRGLGGVKLVVSDQHAGLVAALRRSFQSAAHQRCRVHFARNLLAHVPKSHADMAAAVFRTVFAQPDAATVAATWDEVRDQLTSRFPKIGPLMDTAKTEVLAFSAFPRADWSKVWSTNPFERVNKEIKRRRPRGRDFPQRRRGDPPRRRRARRHARRMAVSRQPPLPLRRIHGAALPRPRYWTHRRDQQRRVGTEDQSSKPTTQRGSARAADVCVCSEWRSGLGMSGCGTRRRVREQSDDASNDGARQGDHGRCVLVLARQDDACNDRD
jgi:hypothetical protein